MELLALICLIWIICIQVKLNKISKIVLPPTNISSEPAIKDQTPQTETMVEEKPEPAPVQEQIDFDTTKLVEEQLAKFEKTKEDKPQKDKDNAESGFEKIMLGNLFNKIGAVAILVGIVIFIKLIAAYIVFTPEMKIGLSYLAGILMCFGAFKLHKKENLKNYAEVLLGTGFGTLFIATYCAKALFNLFTMPVTCIISTVLLLVSFILADKLKTVSMLAISLIAGYLNAFFISHVPNFVIWYLIFVNALALAYTFKNNYRSPINAINLVMTSITALIYYKNGSIAPFITLWGMYYAFDIISTAVYKPEGRNINAEILNYINFAVFSLFIIKLTNDTQTVIAELVTALFYLAALAIKKDNENSRKTYINIILTALNTALYFYTKNHDYRRVYMLAFETAALSCFAYKFKLKQFAYWAAGIWTWAFGAIFCVDNIAYTKEITKYSPLWNVRLWTMAPVALSAAASSYLLKKSDDNKLINLSNIFKFEFVSLIYLYLCFEANDAITKYFSGKNTEPEFLKTMVYTILGFIYSLNFKSLYNNTKFGFFLFMSGFAALVSLLCLFGEGLEYLPIKAFNPVINIRFIAFMTGIGVLAMYAKQFKHEVFKYLAIFLGFILVNIEVTDSIARFNLHNCDYLISIGWIVYAGIITILGILRNIKYLKYSGIVICILTILRIFLFDLSAVSALYKFSAFLTLGAVLMGLSYFYNKKQ